MYRLEGECVRGAEIEMGIQNQNNDDRDAYAQRQALTQLDCVFGGR